MSSYLMTYFTQHLDKLLCYIYTADNAYLTLSGLLCDGNNRDIVGLPYLTYCNRANGLCYVCVTVCM